jgi:hypothetical protein
MAGGGMAFMWRGEARQLNSTPHGGPRQVSRALQPQLQPGERGAGYSYRLDTLANS